MRRHHDTGIPFDVDVDDAGISTSSDPSRSFADGTAADAAAPKAVWFCPGGATSLARWTQIQVTQLAIADKKERENSILPFTHHLI